MTDIKKHTVLKVSNLSIGYRVKNKISTIAKGINFSLSEGNLVGLVGLVGEVACGKLCSNSREALL